MSSFKSWSNIVCYFIVYKKKNLSLITYGCLFNFSEEYNIFKDINIFYTTLTYTKLQIIGSSTGKTMT